VQQSKLISTEFYRRFGRNATDFIGWKCTPEKSQET